MRELIKMTVLTLSCVGCATTGVDGRSELNPTPAATQSTAVAEDAAPAEAQDGGTAKPKVICRNLGTTGSRLGGRRICKTREQWAESSRENQKEVQKLQRGGPGSVSN